MKFGSNVCLFPLCCFSLAIGQEAPAPQTNGSAPKSQGSAPKPPILKAEQSKDDEKSKRVPMTNERLGELIESVADEFEGRPGYWKFTVLSVEILCVTDERANRMRIISPIKSATELTDEEYRTCMSANFDKALDARYCVSNGVLWSAFIHQLGDLTPQMLNSAILQVAGANLNFGTSYSSGGLQFGGGQNADDAEGTKDGEKKKPSKPSVLL